MSITLFKYKSANENNINALLNDSLWVSSLDRMNDPLEMAFYVDKGIDISRITCFQQWLLEQFSCISFSRSKTNRRLWNYYTDGMNGMVIEYSEPSIKKALEEIEISTINYDEKVPKRPPKFKTAAIKGNVVYDGEKVNLSEWYQAFIGEDSNPEILPYSLAFHKDDSWQEEMEYRFVLAGEDVPRNCLLRNIVPKAIYIGYRMGEENVLKVKEYCKKKGVCLYRYTPNFYSRNAKEYSKETLYSPLGLSELAEEAIM